MGTHITEKGVGIFESIDHAFIVMDANDSYQSGVLFNEGGNPRWQLRSDGLQNSEFEIVSRESGNVIRLRINQDGKFIFISAGSGLIRGAISGYETDWIQENAVQNTWYDISTSDINDVELNGVTHDNSGQLTVTEPGIYFAMWSISSEVTATNQHIQIAFNVNGTELQEGQNHYESFGTSKEFPISGNTHLNLTDNATVEIAIRTTDTGTPDIEVSHFSLTLHQIGGN